MQLRRKGGLYSTLKRVMACQYSPLGAAGAAAGRALAAILAAGRQGAGQAGSG